MPSRIIREGILTSDRVEALDFAAEVFYRRLMSKVDDHGLYDGRPSVLRSSLYPLRVDRVREADISRWIAICEKAGLIALYVIGGKPYMQMVNTQWTARSEPKYPPPPWGNGAPPQATVNSCAQPLTPVPVVVDVVEVVVEDEGVKERGAPPKKRADATGTRLPKDWQLPKEWGEWALQHKPAWTAEHVRFIAANFHDVWVSTPGAKGRKTDWRLTWQVWVRREMSKPQPTGRLATLSSAGQQTANNLKNWLNDEGANGTTGP